MSRTNLNVSKITDKEDEKNQLFLSEERINDNVYYLKLHLDSSKPFIGYIANFFIILLFGIPYIIYNVVSGGVASMNMVPLFSKISTRFENKFMLYIENNIAKSVQNKMQKMEALNVMRNWCKLNKILTPSMMVTAKADLFIKIQNWFMCRFLGVDVTPEYVMSNKKMQDMLYKFVNLKSQLMPRVSENMVNHAIDNEFDFYQQFANENNQLQEVTEDDLTQVKNIVEKLSKKQNSQAFMSSLNIDGEAESSTDVDDEGSDRLKWL